VEKANFRPYKAEFYSVSGRLLKVGYYEDYKQVLGCARPMRLVLEDAIQKNKRSVLEYTDMKYEDFPEKMFTHHYLKKLE
jgi:hypothetical protein